MNDARRSSPSNGQGAFWLVLLCLILFIPSPAKAQLDPLEIERQLRIWTGFEVGTVSLNESKVIAVKIHGILPVPGFQQVRATFTFQGGTLVVGGDDGWTAPLGELQLDARVNSPIEAIFYPEEILVEPTGMHLSLGRFPLQLEGSEARYSDQIIYGKNRQDILISNQETRGEVELEIHNAQLSSVPLELTEGSTALSDLKSRGKTQIGLDLATGAVRLISGSFEVEEALAPEVIGTVAVADHLISAETVEAATLKIRPSKAGSVATLEQVSFDRPEVWLPLDSWDLPREMGDEFGQVAVGAVRRLEVPSLPVAVGQSIAAATEDEGSLPLVHIDEDLLRRMLNRPNTADFLDLSRMLLPFNARADREAFPYISAEAYHQFLTVLALAEDYPETPALRLSLTSDGVVLYRDRHDLAAADPPLYQVPPATVLIVGEVAGAVGGKVTSTIGLRLVKGPLSQAMQAARGALSPPYNPRLGQLAAWGVLKATEKPMEVPGEIAAKWATESAFPPSDSVGVGVLTNPVVRNGRWDPTVAPEILAILDRTTWEPKVLAPDLAKRFLENADERSILKLLPDVTFDPAAVQRAQKAAEERLYYESSWRYSVRRSLGTTRYRYLEGLNQAYGAVKEKLQLTHQQRHRIWDEVRKKNDKALQPGLRDIRRAQEQREQLQEHFQETWENFEAKRRAARANPNPDPNAPTTGHRPLRATVTLGEGEIRMRPRIPRPIEAPQGDGCQSQYVFGASPARPTGWYCIDSGND